MNKKKVLGFCLVVLFSLFTSACFTIEKEIFLNADGSGELVLHVSMPDLPESSKAATAGAPKDPAAEIEKFKRDIMTKLPPTVKLKEAKQVKQNGVLSFYAIVSFKNLQDTEKLLDNFGQGDSGQPPSPDQYLWTSAVEKQGTTNTFRERFFFEVSSMTGAQTSGSTEAKTTPPPAKSGTTARGSRQNRQGKAASGQEAATVSADIKMEGMEQLEAMLLALIRLRIVVHTPSPIRESNADLVLNGRIAVWNCSLLNFAKDKKPIELKATY